MEPQTEGEHDTHHYRVARRTENEPRPAQPWPDPVEIEPDWLVRLRKAGW